MTVNKAVILNQQGKARPCDTRNCFEWVFTKDDAGELACPRCNTYQTMIPEESEGVFPRPGNEYVDRLNQQQRHSFWSANGGVKRVNDRTGKWFESDLVCELMEEAQNEINQLRARLARLEPKGVDNE